jgi:uncharacterized protein YdhG (YjbR/CyaY superfamily)
MAEKSTKKTSGFTAEEKAAMKERAAELKAAKAGADCEKQLLDAVNKMPAPDKALGKKLHDLVKAAAPHLTAKTWYGMPAWAKDGKVLCFFQPASKFKARYGTFGFSDEAKLDQGDMWPTSFALTKLGPAEQKKLSSLVRKAAK